MFEQMMAEMDQTDLELIEAQSMLEVKRDAYRQAGRSQQPTQQDDAATRGSHQRGIQERPRRVGLQAARSTRNVSISTISKRNRAAAPRPGKGCGPEAIR